MESSSRPGGRSRVGWLTIGGEPRLGRVVLRRNLVFGGPASGPDHEAIIRFGGKAPGRRAHSSNGVATMDYLVSPPPRIVIGGLSRRGDRLSNSCVGFSATWWSSGSLYLSQHDALWCNARRDHAPERDQEFPRERHDHGRLAGAPFGPSVRDRKVPSRQCAVLLEYEEPPCELDQSTAHPSVTGPGQPLLASDGPALVGRSRQASIARHGPSVAQFPRQHLSHQHVRWSRRRRR